MGEMTMLTEAQAAGLTVAVDGDKLVIRGPRSADALARRLLAHKAELLAMLCPTPEATPAPPVASPDVATPDVENAFADWVFRTDANGRIGLEAPSLPEVDRWWATAPWEGLPRAPSAPPKPTKAVCRCGSDIWRDVPIHEGQSSRRDCAHCGRFIGFPVWQGKQRFATPSPGAMQSHDSTQSPSGVPTRQNGV